MYVSHFIQVLSMCIVRGEIARSKRVYYGLPENEDTIPNLFSEASVLEWGKKIMEGEQRRQGEGGIPIYNPTMGRVSVIFEMFKEKHDRQVMLQQRTAEALQNIADMRFEADEIIFEAWSEIEKAFSSFQGEARLKHCARYGIFAAVNQAAVSGCVPAAAVLSLMLPANIRLLCSAMPTKSRSSPRGILLTSRPPMNTRPSPVS